MSKTLADHALELAENATKGPWVAREEYSYHPDQDKLDYEVCDIVGPIQYHTAFQIKDAEFIAASRMLVPELAKRLKHSCDIIRVLAHELTRVWRDISKVMKEVEELERMPE